MTEKSGVKAKYQEDLESNINGKLPPISNSAAKSKALSTLMKERMEGITVSTRSLKKSVKSRFFS